MVFVMGCVPICSVVVVVVFDCSRSVVGSSGGGVSFLVTVGVSDDSRSASAGELSNSIQYWTRNLCRLNWTRAHDVLGDPDDTSRFDHLPVQL